MGCSKGGPHGLRHRHRDAYGWRAVYIISAFAIALVAFLLAWRLPHYRTAAQSTYWALIGSLWQILRQEPVLRRRALTASLVAASFSLFWTTVALRLAMAPFNLDLLGIALFALAGAGGALATPLAGRIGDRGWTRSAMVAAHISIVVSAALAAWAGTSDAASRSTAILVLGFSAILLDIGLTFDHTLGRREINLIRPEARGRLNGLFVGLFFIGGSTGAAISGVTWALGGWTLTCAACAAFAILSLVSDFVSKSSELS
ncbi:MFS transporter [Agrobacterium rhizogenes]|uniref:MFS transporter n=1 Tax=Rhizobium rhizogenes TaxID=359 RepID=UPI0015736C3C|nr:MFS transporter [Rhizobium rhizogenes]NTF59609.1 MFS transporter [Rhizobium rhizogenes]NTF65903.1 MFS transporter [Rhizobium rhizogenes]NTF79169.1 MFS transporter [Rhizobium rhizogenes]NTG04820.1 MFS transporter [Rhizobium rhizogenes]